jgi:nitrite reductase/ring-hydroxylating ferredoxin subunit
VKDGPENPARPAAGVRLCAVGEIAEPGSKGFRFRAESRLFAAFVVRADGQVRGWIDQCPHAGWPLGFDDRYLTRTGEHILCAGHGALFGLDGAGVTAPCVGERLTVWPVEVRDGEIFTA